MIARPDRPNPSQNHTSAQTAKSTGCLIFGLQQTFCFIFTEVYSTIITREIWPDNNPAGDLDIISF